MVLADLPVETFFDILSLLDAQSLCACRQVCKAFCRTIDESKLLQYCLRLSMCGYSDCPTLPPRPIISPADKLEALQTHIDRWHALDWTESRIRVPHGFLYEFMSGVYCAATSTSVTVVQLPSRTRGLEAKQWTHHDFDFIIVDFTFDPSQDLLVLAEKYSPPTWGLRHYLPRIHFRTLSTNEKHPLARREYVDIALPTFQPFNSLVMRTSGGTVGVFFRELREVNENAFLTFVDWAAGSHGPITTLDRGPLTWCWLSPSYIALPHRDRDNRQCVALLHITPGNDNDTLDTPCIFHLPDDVFTSARVLGQLSESTLLLHCDPSPDFSPPARPFVIGSDRVMKILWPISSSEGHGVEVLEIFVRISSLLKLAESPPSTIPSEETTPAERSVWYDDEGTRHFGWHVWGPQNSRTFYQDSSPNEFQCFTFGMRAVSLSGSWKVRVRTFGGGREGWPYPDGARDRNTTTPDGGELRLRWSGRDQELFVAASRDREDGVMTCLPYHTAQRTIGFTLRGLYPHGIMCDDEHIILVEALGDALTDTLVVYTM